MNALNDIADDEFLQFLQGLGVETYKSSFGWMLNDPDFAGVLRWIYNSLDHNNALSAREEYRYKEIQKKGGLLSPEDLEAAIASIQEQYPGICLPGDQDAVEDVKLDILFQEERLATLEKQEAIVKDLIRQNVMIKEQLTLELMQLNSAHKQCVEDEQAAADECMTLAKELESHMEEVIHVIADNLDVYANCKGDKDVGRRFMTFSPIESYRQSMALFRSHHDLYVSKHLGNNLHMTNRELQAAAAEATTMEDRLSDAAFAYIKSKADLSGEQAILAIVSNSNNIHPSQIETCLMETRSSIQLLEQEESIAEQQVRSDVDKFVKSRTELAVTTATAAALEVRLQIQTSLTHLVEVWQRATSLDRILYYSLRRELKTLEEFVQFAADLRQYATDDANAVSTRIESMNEICSEHAACSEKLQTSNPLLQALSAILGVPLTNDPSVLVKAYNDLLGNVKELKQNVQDGFRKKEDGLTQFKKLSRPLREYVWSGSTRQAHCWDVTVASLSHSLKHQMEGVDKRVLEAQGIINSVKNGDKRNLRKLWQWFLTDPARFKTATRNCYF